MTEAQRLAKEKKAHAQPQVVDFLLSVVLDVGADMKDRIAAAKPLMEGLDALKIEMDATVKTEASETVAVIAVDPERLRRIAGVLRKAGVLEALQAEVPKAEET